MAAGMGTLVQVLVGGVALVVVLPWILARPQFGERVAVRFWSALVIGLLFWIGWVDILLITHLFSMMILYAGAVAGGMVVRRYRPIRRSSEEVEARMVEIGRLLDAADPANTKDMWEIVAKWVNRAVLSVQNGIRWMWRPAPMITLVVLVAVTAMYAKGPLSQVVPATRNDYSYLLLIREMGFQQQFFGLGLFPQGMHALLAGLYTMLFANAMNVLRFFGLMVALMQVLAGGWLAYEIRRNAYAAAGAMVLIGFTSLPGLGASGWHLTQPLPLKMASALVVVGITFAIRHVRRGSREDLWMLAMTSTLIALIQPEASPFLLVGVGVLAVVDRVYTAGAGLRDMGVAVLAGTLAGIIPLGVGWLGHIPPNTYLGYLAAPSASQTARGLDSAIGLGGVGALYTRLKGLGSPDARLWFSLALSLVIWAFMAKLPAVGWISPAGVTFYGGMVGLVALPAVAAWILGDVQLPQISAPILGVLVAVGLVLAFHPATPPQLFQPPGSGQVLLQIEKKMTPFDWTVISPVEEYSEVLGRGWHVELITFLHQFPLADAQNPQFGLKQAKNGIQTSDIFFFVEPVPFGSRQLLTPAERQAPLPSSTGLAAYQGANRAVVEAHALAWVQAYAQTHPGTVTLYYHNPVFRVYRIHQ